MKEKIFYCEKKNNEYSEFFANPLGVQMCGVNKINIVKVKVREALENETSTHYAWWDNKDKELDFVFKKKVQVDMCFPYGAKVEIEAGYGDIIGVVVEEIYE